MGNCLVYRVEEEYEEEPNVIKNKLYTIYEQQVKFVDEYEKKHPTDTYNDYIYRKQFKRASVYEKILSWKKLIKNNTKFASLVNSRNTLTKDYYSHG